MQAWVTSLPEQFPAAPLPEVQPVHVAAPPVHLKPMHSPPRQVATERPSEDAPRCSLAQVEWLIKDSQFHYHWHSWPRR